MTAIKIQIGNNIFTATLLANASSQTLMEMLPMTVTMTELNSNEKYFNMPKHLPVNAQPVGKINSGDLMLYGSNCLVIFYESFSTPYSYTRLGYIEDVTELASAPGKGNVEVNLRLAT